LGGNDYLLLKFLTANPPLIRLIFAPFFSRQPRERTISIGIVTAGLILPILVIFLLFLSFSFIGNYRRKYQGDY